jgi:hypothetical protein
MQPIITIRRYEDKDLRQMQEVVRNSVMSHFSSAFWFCLFREVRNGRDNYELILMV